MKKLNRVCNEGAEQNESGELDAILMAYMDDRVIIIDEEITPKMIRTVVVPLLRLDEDEDESPIDIYVNTIGGDAVTTLAICDAIDKLKCPTTVHILGCAYSGGLWIASAGRDNKNVRKVAYANAEFMYHRLSSGYSGSMSEIETECEHARGIQKRLDSYLISHTDIDEKELKRYKDKDWFFSADAARGYGIVDEVL